jgi:hypothetical protein
MFARKEELDGTTGRLVDKMGRPRLAERKSEMAR